MRSFGTAGLAGAAITLAALALPESAPAQQVACGGDYTVARGDSLSAIAQRA